MTSEDKVLIFDTTLRDGEQSPGVALGTNEKQEMARALEKMRVDFIYAGFAPPPPREGGRGGGGGRGRAGPRRAPAAKLCSDVEFSPMDATRSEPEYVFRMLTECIEAGATTVNIPDTVGYAIPEEF